MLLEVEDLCVNYGRIEAIRDISFTVDEGEIVTLIGANGAGKTTTHEDGLRPAPGRARARSCSRARTSPTCRRTSGRCSGIAPVARGPRLLRRHDGARRTSTWAPTPARTARRRRSSRTCDRVFDLFPRLQERRNQVGRHDVRRRAADARHRPGADGPTPSCCCSTSRRWGWRPADPADLRRSSPRSTSRARRCCSSSRTPPRRSSAAHRAYILETGEIVREGTGQELRRRPRGQGGLPRRRRQPDSRVEPRSGGSRGRRHRTTASAAHAPNQVTHGATTRAGSRSPTGTCLIRSSRSADADQQQPAGRGERGRCARRAARRRAAAPSSGQRALDAPTTESADGDTPAERRGERDRGEPVQRRLQQQLVDAAARARRTASPGSSAGRRRTAATPSTNPSMNRSRRRVVAPALAAPSVGAGRAVAASAAEPLEARPRCAAASRRSPPISSDPSTISIGRRSPTRRANARSVTRDRRQARDEQGDQAEPVGDHASGCAPAAGARPSTPMGLPTRPSRR